MNYRNMKTAGRILSVIQMHRWNAALTPADYVRVTYTHQVLKEQEDNFDALVGFLVRAFTVITPGEFFRMFETNELGQGRRALITFDDGLMSSYHAIKRIASKYGVKTVMFVPTQILELKTTEDKKRFAWQQLNFKNGPAPADFREEEFLTMGKEEILELHKDGHAVFPHTHTHKRLNEIHDQSAADAELVRPRKILEGILQSSMDAVAFPVGTERVVSRFAFSCIRKEYKYCFSALAGKNTPATDPYYLRRDCMNADYEQDHVNRVEQGVFDPYYSFKVFRLKQASQG